MKPTRSNKKLLLVSLTIVIIMVLGIGFFFYSQTYSVSGTISDISTKQPLPNVKVIVSDKTSNTDSNGHYSISGLRFYQDKKLSVSASHDYNSFNALALTYPSNRILIKNVSLEPSLVHVANVLGSASINHQYDYEWTYMHPDSQKYWGDEKTYVTLLKQRDDYQARFNKTVKTISAGNNIRHLDIWHDPITNKTYSDVMEVPMAEIDVNDGKEQPVNWLDYYKRTDGFYHYFTSVDKNQLRDTIDTLKSLE